MLLSEAKELITTDRIIKKQVWSDLGCGTGTFTLALAGLLSSGSKIYAVDVDKKALNEIPDRYKDIEIIKIDGDFASIKLPANLDGILMANSLHFIEDKITFIKKISSNLNPEGCFLIVEYDIDKGNRWVPYPVSFNSLKQLFSDAGFKHIERIGERESVYQRGKIYSAVIYPFS